MSWFYILAALGLRFGSIFVELILPAYGSIMAIESKNKADDTQWLIYWLTYSMFQIFQSFAWPVLAWIPGYNVLRLALFSWLALPHFRGAQYVYEDILRPSILYLRKKIKSIEPLEEWVQKLESSLGGPAFSEREVLAAQPPDYSKVADKLSTDANTVKQGASNTVAAGLEGAESAAHQTSASIKGYFNKNNTTTPAYTTQHATATTYKEE